MASVPREVLCSTKGPLNVTNRTAVEVENSLKRNVEKAEQAIIGHRKRERAIDQQLHLFTHLLDKLLHWRQSLERVSNPAARAKSPRTTPPADLTASFVQPVSVARERELSAVQRAVTAINIAADKIAQKRSQLDELLARLRGEAISLECICARDANAFAITMNANRGGCTTHADKSGASTPSTPTYTGAYLPFLNATQGSNGNKSSPRRGDSPRQNERSLGSDFSSHWEARVAATYASSFDALHEAGELQRSIEAECRRLVAECNLQHNVAINVMNTATDARLAARNSDIADIRNIEQRVVELRKEWRNISDAAIAMRDPLATAAVRHSIRDNEDDAVNAKIHQQQEATTAARKEVKKRCKVLHDEVQRLEALYMQRQSELRAMEGMTSCVSAQGTQQLVQHTLMAAVPLTQKSGKCESIRTYPEHASLASPFAIGSDTEVTTVRPRTFWPVLSVGGKAGQAIPKPPPTQQ